MQVKKRLRQIVQREPHPAKFIPQHLENHLVLRPLRQRMARGRQVRCLPDSLIKADPRCPAPLGMGIHPLDKHAAEKERVVRHVRAQHIGLLRRTVVQPRQIEIGHSK